MTDLRVAPRPPCLPCLRSRNNSSEPRIESIAAGRPGFARAESLSSKPAGAEACRYVRRSYSSAHSSVVTRTVSEPINSRTFTFVPDGSVTGPE